MIESIVDLFAHLATNGCPLLANYQAGLSVGAFWVTALVGWIVLYIPHFLWWFVNLFLVRRWVSEYNDAVLIARQQQF